MQRYFVDEIVDSIVKFDNDQEKHILKVMRMKVNDQITCCYQGEVFLCEIASISPLEARVVEKLDEDHELPVDVTLFYCLPKGDKLDLVLQKATELGVKEIVLVQSSRCIAKIKKEDEARKLVRFNTIIKEASEQSKRSFLPLCNKIINYKDIDKFSFDHSFIAYENEKDETYLHQLETIKDGESIAVLVGSEGGFSLDEVKYAQSKGYTSVSLGKRILRSETAVFYALSAISLIVEGR